MPLAVLHCFALLALAAIPAATTAQTVDTSEWLCEFCPFESGSYGDYEVGASNVSDDSAYVGDASGYDEEGTYAAVNGNGGYNRDGNRHQWTVGDLGLDSRSFAVRGGLAGTFDYRVAYRELPRRQFNTTSSVFTLSDRRLSLPPAWVRAPSTDGLTNLDSSLVAKNIESDRNLYEIGASYLPTNRWTISADFRRQERSGNRILGGSYFTNAALLPAQIDYATDEAYLGLRFAGDKLALTAGWQLSDFDNGKTSFGWEHPFLTADGAEFAQLAAPPDNRFQQLTLAAAYAFATMDTHASFSAAIGELEQTEPFLPYTSNANLGVSPLPRNDLAGSIDTTRLAFALTANPVRKTRVRLSYRTEERDNQSARELWNRVIADSFVSGDLEMNIPYSFERNTLRASAEYRLLSSLRLSAGYDRVDKDYDFQEVAEQTEDTGWGRVRWRPVESLEFNLRGGTAKRDIDRYNEVFAEMLGQNPLLRKYNLAYRFREFGELSLTYSPSMLPLTLTVDAMLADDQYTKSQLGLTEGEQFRVGADLNWLMTERSTIYLNVGLEDISSRQSGGATGTTPWNASYDDELFTIGAGVIVRGLANKLDLVFDYLRSSGGSEITVDPAGAEAEQFPELVSDLDRAELRLSWRQSERLDINFDLRYQRFHNEAWMLEGVGPATIPVVLSLGAKPYTPEVYIVGVGLRYRWGAP